MSTVSKENYLKAIFNKKILDNDFVTTSQMAQELDVSNAAISDMAKKLANEGLIKYEKYKGMGLTSKGERMALQVIRRHRLWELFLIKILGLNWCEIHDEAENLEHHTSDFLIDKIDEYLGYPKFDPHGHPIPQKNGTIPKSPKVFSLFEGEIKVKYKFIRVDDRDNSLIDYFTKIGLLLETEIVVLDRLAFDQSLTVKFNNKIFLLSKKISKSIFVIQVD